MSDLLKLDSKDFIRGLVVAVLTAVLTWLLDAMNVATFNFADLSLYEAVRIGVVAGVAYLIKNLATDTEGKLMGKI